MNLPDECTEELIDQAVQDYLDGIDIPVETATISEERARELATLALDLYKQWKEQ